MTIFFYAMYWKCRYLCRYKVGGSKKALIHPYVIVKNGPLPEVVHAENVLLSGSLCGCGKLKLISGIPVTSWALLLSFPLCNDLYNLCPMNWRTFLSFDVLVQFDKTEIYGLIFYIPLSYIQFPGAWEKKIDWQLSGSHQAVVRHSCFFLVVKFSFYNVN